MLRQAMLGWLVLGAACLSMALAAEDKPADTASKTKPAANPVAAPAAKPAPAPTAAPATKPAPAAAAVPEASTPKDLHERTIYIPYKKLRDVFEKEGRGVFLPYEKFQEMWRAAQTATTPSVPGRPPVAAVISQVENDAVAGKDLMRVQAKIVIDVLTEGWHQVPLRLGDAAITSAAVAGQPARIMGSPAAGYTVLVHNPEKKPRSLELVLDFAKAIAKAPGQNTVSFQAPDAAVSRWKIRVPERGVKINVEPLVAATSVPASAAGDNETAVMAFVGAAPSVRILWTPKAEGAAGLEALATVQTELQLSIAEGALRTRARLAYAVTRAELPRLVVEAPADQKIVNVFDANVRQWTVAKEQGVQRITAELFEPAKLGQELVVEMERAVDDKTLAALVVPVVKAVGVARQQGVVVVDLASDLRAEPLRRLGVLQIDAAELPPGLSKQSWAYAFRFASVPFDLALAIDKIAPRLEVASLTEAYIEPERLSIDWSAHYTIERAGLFRLELELPEGFEVRQVRGSEVGPAKAAAVESHRREGNRLTVELARKALGTVGLYVELGRDLRQAELLRPSDKPTEIAVGLIRPQPKSTDAASSKLIVYAPESLQVAAGGGAAVRPIPLDEAGRPVASRRGGKLPSLRPVLAFAATDAAAAAPLLVERLKPQVSVAQMLAVSIEDGVVRYQATFFYDVRFSGIRGLRIDVPKKIAPRIHVKRPGLVRQEIVPPPADVAADYVAWNFAGEAELLGAGRLVLTWDDDEKLAALAVGKSVVFPVWVLEPKDVDRAWGQVVLTKAETIDVEESDEKGLRPIDPQHDLMPNAGVSGAARAFQFDDQWSLSIKATRYQLEELKRTSVERSIARMVVTPAGQIAVQAVYRLRSAKQRLEVTLPAESQFDTEPLRINGRPAPLERGGDGRYFVPLLDSAADEPLLLELRYTMPGSGRRLDLPDFGDAAVQKVFLCVYLPKNQSLLFKRGPWSEEFDWWLDPQLDWVPQPRASDSDLLRWVTEGKPGEAEAMAFQTDGRVYIFSTLQPAAPPAGSLKLAFVNATALAIGVLLAVVLAGVALLPAGATTRVVVVGALLIALILCGLFAPIAAWQLIDGTLFGALVIVAVIWLVAWFAWRRPRQRPAGQSPFAPGEASPAGPAGPAPQPVVATAVSEPSPAREPASGDRGHTDAAPPSDRAGKDAEGGPSHA